jgi:hypothetical protein
MSAAGPGPTGCYPSSQTAASGVRAASCAAIWDCGGVYPEVA